MSFRQQLVRLKRAAKRIRDTRWPPPDWRDVLIKEQARWDEARASASGPSVLLATNVGWFAPGIELDSLLAVALTLRGARVSFALCDKVLPACLAAEFHRFPSPEKIETYQLRDHLCDSCYDSPRRVYEKFGLPVVQFSKHLKEEDRASARAVASSVPFADIPKYRDATGFAVGEHAFAGTLRFFGRGDLDGEEKGEVVLRRYFEAALLSSAALNRAFEVNRYDVVSLHHGIYLPQGNAAAVATNHGARVAAWNVAYRKKCFIFSHDTTYHHTLMDEPTAVWENMPFGAAEERKILTYLRSRWVGSNDWIWFFEKPEENPDAVVASIGFDKSKPTVGLLTNVVWDAQLHYPANAFKNMVEWVIETIRYFASRPDLQLVVRIHPAEIRGTVPSRQPVEAEIRRAFPVLPGNVFVVAPETNVSTYALMERCCAALIYGTKMGVELASVGLPVIVAGEAWIRNKGISYDAKSKQEYIELLDRLPLPPMDAASIRRARMYAYHFFFRRMIPLECIDAAHGWPPYKGRIKSLDDLAPGVDPGLDLICDGILKGTPFVYDEARVPTTDDAPQPQVAVSG